MLYVVWVITKVYSVISEPSQSSSRPVGLIRATEQLIGELPIYKVLLLASTLLLVKTENIYRNTKKMHITMEKELRL